MKVTVPHRTLVRLFRWSEWTLFTWAMAALGYSAVVYFDAQQFQAWGSRRFERDVAIGAIRAHQPEIPKFTPSGSLVGRIEVERLGLSVMIAEGVDAKTLRRAVGHVPGTAMPGESGNVSIAGHRDTFFRSLRDIQEGDVISLTTLWGDYRYRVTLADIVNPQDVEVLRPARGEILTLITCYPFYFVGDAPDRFIVRAERIG